MCGTLPQANDVDPEGLGRQQLTCEHVIGGWDPLPNKSVLWMITDNAGEGARRHRDSCHGEGITQGHAPPKQL